MLVNLTGGPLDGQTKDIKQRTKEFPESLTWPTENHKGAKYVVVSEGGKGKPAEFRYKG